MNAQTPTTIFDFTQVWKYNQTLNLDATPTWKDAAFVDTSWQSGGGSLYNDANTPTPVLPYPTTTSLTIGRTTYYFRTHFTFSGSLTGAKLTFVARIDDGAVFYLNGTEVKRIRMPAGAVAYATSASGPPNPNPPAGGSKDASGFDIFTLSGSQLSSLIVGDNVIAVEVHQWTADAQTPADIAFGMRLTTSAITRGPYLQTGTPTSIIIRWNTSLSELGVVTYGTTPGSLNLSQPDGSATTDHTVTLMGLTPDTTYYYSVGTAAETYESGAGYFFITAPTPGTAKNTRIWVLGDSGTQSANQDAVRNAYYAYTATRHTDLWLMLGDNAYDGGSVAEYDAAVFQKYQAMLRKSVLWPTLGNHDTGQATTFNDSYPYFTLFNLPTAHEAGGVSSLSEHYYSFDYGNIHFICLDSMTGRPVAAMTTWLNSDLSQNLRDWTIAFWHHPPYTKGSHNSDTETELIQMRQNFLPILEASGIDLVLTGHSHSYERSKLINGHYGLSPTYTDALYAKDAGTGNGATPYQKPTLGKSPNEGTVYVVAGSSGQISGGTLNHPAMKVSLNNLGSLVLDINNGGTVNQLVGTFVRENGTTPDTFTIQKKVQTVTVGSVIHAAEPSTPGSFTLTRSGGNTLQPLTVKFALTGTATAGTVGTGDYAVSGTASFTPATGLGTATIPIGSATKVVTITPNDDTTWEGTETVILTVTTANSYSVGTPSTATLNITDNDLVTVTVVATDPIASEGGSDTGQFTITRTGSADMAITVNYSLGGTATRTGPGQDYATLPDSVSIPPGGASASATVTISPVNDSTTEVSETVILTATLPGTGYTVGNPASGTVTIVGNDGPDPTFGSPVSYTVGGTVQQVIVADVNGGYPDIITANYSANNISVFLAKSLGDDFQGPYNTTVGNGPVSVVAGHWNTDGKPDLAVANSLDSTVSILSGNLDGTFSLSATYATGAGAPGAQFITVGDFNADGKPDLAVVTINHSVSILLNTTSGSGTPSFSTATSYSTGGGLSRRAGVGDFNGDGKPDLAVTANDGTVNILLNNGSGGFGLPTPYTTGSKPYGVVVGYFDQDAALDLAVVNLDQATVTVLKGIGDGTFTPFTPINNYDVGGGRAIVAGDFNNDSLLDLIATDEYNNNLWMLVGNGDGSFEPSFSFSSGMTSTTIAAGQFGADGRLDLVIGNSGSAVVKVLLNNTVPNP